MDEIIEFEDLAVKRASSSTAMVELVKKVQELNKNGYVIQIFDSRIVLSSTHIVGAYLNAKIAFKNGSNKTKSIGMEMLLFAAITDQIDRALKISGAKKSSDFVLFYNKKNLSFELEKFLRIGTDFQPSISEIENAAKALGIKVDRKDRKEIDAQILQKMALSRLASD